jgi:hypothetical protein
MRLGGPKTLFRRGDGFSPPRLDETQERVLEAMRRDGIAVVSFDELFGDSELWATLSDDIGDFARATESRLDELRQRTNDKTYLVRRFLQKPAPRFELGDPWLQLGLSRQVLDIVNSYRNESTRLVDLDNWYTIPDPSADERVLSQQWHRDPWDDHIVKVFTYFSDVDEAAGPFEYICGSPAGGRYGDIWPWSEGNGGSVYPPQDELLQRVDPADIRTVTGPAATIIFADTGGFHRGGWAESKPRVLSYHTFVSTHSGKKSRLRVQESRSVESLTSPARFAIDLSLIQ